MIWDNLKEKKCPICGYELDIVQDRYKCSDIFNCDFSIGLTKFKELTEDQELGDGFCESCGDKINPRWRLCRRCEREQI